MSEQEKSDPSKDERVYKNPIPTLTGIVILGFIAYQILFSRSPSQFGLSLPVEKILKISIAAIMGGCLFGIVISYFVRARRQSRRTLR